MRHTKRSSGKPDGLRLTIVSMKRARSELNHPKEIVIDPFDGVNGVRCHSYAEFDHKFC
jgi:hypothetical protein